MISRFHTAFGSGRPALVAALIVALLALTSSSSALADPPAAGAAIVERWAALAQEAETLRASPLGLVPILELERHTRWVPFSALAEVLGPIVEAEDTHPIVRAAAAHRVARALLAAGDVDGSAAVIVSEGYLTDWSIIGPFSNESMVGFESVFGPEVARDPEATYGGHSGPVGWRDVSELTRAGYVDVGRLAPPGTSSVYYGVTQVEASRSGRARLWTAVDGAFKLWVNGALVAMVDADLGAGAVREWWAVDLRRGVNEVVIKVAGDETRPGFFARLTDREGGPLAAWDSSAAVLPDDRPLRAATEPNPEPSGTLATALEELLAGAGIPEALTAEEALIGAALVLQRYYPRDPAEPWRRFTQESGGCDNGSPRALLICAQVSEHYWERRRALNRAVVHLAPDADPMLWRWALYELADLTLGSVGDSLYEDVRRLSEQILESDPDFVPARLLLARIWESERQLWRAHQAFLQAVELAPESPEVLYQAQWGYQQVGSTPELIVLYERALEGRWDQPSAASTLARALARAGRTDEGLAVLERALAVQPLSLGLYWLQADLHVSAGRTDEGLALLRQTLDIFPGDVRALEELAKQLLAADRIDEAVATFDQALALEPQNEALAQYRQVFIADDQAFYSDLRLELDELLALELPEELADGRDYTVVAQQRVTRVFPNGLYSQYVQEAYRVQTRQGADQLREYAITFTPDDENVEILRARVVKPDGTILESFGRWEQSLSQPWYGLYYDYRALVLGFETLAPGDLLEVEYTLANVSRQNIFDDYYGDFVFVQDSQPKAFVRVGVLTPSDLTLHVRRPNLPHEASELERDDGRLTLFELRDVPHVDMEASMPGQSSVADYLHVSTFETWAEVSEWYWNLVEDQLVTSPEIERTVDELTEGLETTEEIVSAIHEYVVRNTRYVGLEFGIHGYRPYRTTVIFARRFGDCKDTASLIKVMLGLAGVDAHLVLLRTRDLGALEQDPPSLSVFNHAIAYVPDLDLYLDGTAGYSGVDELPYLDQGASILVVRDGAEHDFGRLPYLATEASRIEYDFSVDLAAPGSPTRARVSASGQFAPPLRVGFEDEENRLEAFQRDFTEQFAGAVVTGLSFAGLDDINTPVVVDFDFSEAVWIQGSEERPGLMPLGVPSQIARRLAGSATRRQALMLDFPYVTSHRIDYRLPDGLSATEPVDASTESPFGRYRLVVTPTEGGMSVESELVISATEVSIEDYPAFREFLQSYESVVNRTIPLERSTDG